MSDVKDCSLVVGIKSTHTESDVAIKGSRCSSTILEGIGLLEQAKSELLIELSKLKKEHRHEHE